MMRNESGTAMRCSMALLMAVGLLGGCANKVSPELVTKLAQAAAVELAGLKQQLKDLDASAQKLRERIAADQKTGAQVTDVGSEAMRKVAPALEKMDAARSPAAAAVAALDTLSQGIAGRSYKRQELEDVTAQVKKATDAVPPTLTAYGQAISDVEALVNTYEHSAVVVQDTIDTGTNRTDHE